MLATLRTGVASKGMNALKSTSSIATRSFSNSNSAAAIPTLPETMSPEDRLVYGEPLQIPPTHNITVAHLHLRSYLPQQLEFFTDFARRAAAALDMPCTGAIPLPVQTSKWTVNKSPFVYKKAQETFERKTHKRLLAIRDTNPEVVRRWVQFLNQNSMAGVGMKITTWEHVELGAGQKRLETVQKGEARNRSVAEMMKNVDGSAEVSSNAHQEPSKEVKAVADQLLAEMMKDIGGEEEIAKDNKKNEQSTTETPTPSPEVATPENPEQPTESPIADAVEPLVSGSSTLDPELSKIVEKAVAETATQTKKD
ncbi:small subunit ribosomal protein S10 [Entomortierella parvispora]|uniref:Small ribosomal subunit protein uS10m n=1 Tax=Entomortierella parvispora TaxID=205924 RepID=A0A9P3LXF0_9FUNG|nr:small subunit ribosomal protein S10 [Entomortierella parvispora]